MSRTYDQLTPNGNRTPASYRATAEQAGGKVKFAYLSADFANPTGETVDLAAREKPIDLGDELDIAIIEDAAYQSLRYDGEAILPILALEIARKGNINDTRTIYCGSFSKTLAPGLRVGFVVANAPVIRKLVLMKQAADLHSSTINQIAIHHVAERGFDAQVAKVRKTYSHRRDCMLAALAKYMPAGTSWTKPEGRHVRLDHPCRRVWTGPSCWQNRWRRRRLPSCLARPSSRMAPARTRSASASPAPMTK